MSPLWMRSPEANRVAACLPDGCLELSPREDEIGLVIDRLSVLNVTAVVLISDGFRGLPQLLQTAVDLLIQAHDGPQIPH